MQNTVGQNLLGVADPSARNAIRVVLESLCDRYSTQSLNSAGLVINGAGNATAKIGATPYYASVQGKLASKAAGSAMAALAGTVANGTFNLFCFFIDVAGALSTAMGAPGATLGAVRFPAIPVGKALIGFVVVNPTGTGSFVGGTTALDDATVVPNAVYVNVVGAFDPSHSL